MGVRPLRVFVTAELLKGGGNMFGGVVLSSPSKNMPSPFPPHHIQFSYDPETHDTVQVMGLLEEKMRESIELAQVLKAKQENLTLSGTYVTKVLRLFLVMKYSIRSTYTSLSLSHNPPLRALYSGRAQTSPKQRGVLEDGVEGGVG